MARSARSVVRTSALAATGNLGASFNSEPLPVARMTEASVQAVVSSSSSLNGTLKLQATDDLAVQPGDSLVAISGLSNWTDIIAAQTITADGANMFNVSAIGYRWIRLAYTRTGGTGTLTMTFAAKGR